MKRNIVITIISAAAVLLVFCLFRFWMDKKERTDRVLKVGIIYEGDESTPYTNNFIHTQQAIESQFGDKVVFVVKNNVPEEAATDVLNELVEEKCELIFANSYGYAGEMKKIAGEHPDIQFCQATGDNAAETPFYENYHTFMGEIYQGRYVTGVVAGMKLKELIDSGEISKEEAKIGYVAAYSCAEVVSGYTAFLLGVRSVVDSAVMTVKYTNTWGNYYQEKVCAQELIEEGCVVISQHSDTIGPAVACEENRASKTVFHVGYNQSMIDVAPTTSLISSKINWTPYMSAAVEAVLTGKDIDQYVKGNKHKNDVGGGLEEDWVQILELNSIIAADGTDEKIDEVIRDIKRGDCEVFKGNYIGVNPEDESDTCDLSEGYKENKDSSAPTFFYILKDVITIEQ